MKTLFSFNFLSRILFLLLTPTIFRALNFAFIWHSIYWGAITFVVLIWGFFIIISPLFGRIGCGWLCFMGTVQDFTSQHSFYKIKWNNPIFWLRILFILGFFASSVTFLILRFKSGEVDGIRFDPGFLDMDFNAHYKHVWLYDILGAVLMGLFLERRWVCRNMCFMGALCASGASYSRLLPVVDTEKCTLCRKCEIDCLVRIPITEYIQDNHGLVTNAECLICGKCIDSCKPGAMKIKFIWNRKRYIQENSRNKPN